jgi:hypothetical protein
MENSNLLESITRMSLRDNRPTFYHNDAPVRAAGVLFWRRVNNKIDLLLIENSWTKNFEDIGGKTDIVDTNYVDTIAREVEEETNGIIKASYIKTNVPDTRKYYCKDSKYLLHVVKADQFVAGLKQEDFGQIELHTGYARNIKWINKNDYFKKPKNPRLEFYKLNSFISSLK